MFVGDGRWFSPPPHSYPAHIAPLPSSLPQEAKEGEGGGGGAGLPLGTAVAQSISPKPRNFLLPKKMAVIGDATNLNELKTKQDANKYKHDMTMANAKELSEKMKSFELVFKIKAGENGKIKTLGVYNIEIKLFEGITGVLKVNVIAE